MNHLLLTDLGKNTEVTGVASGTKIRNGVNTGEPCIVIYVPKKRPLSELTAKEIIPKRIDGKLVDVQESVFKALGLLPSPVRPKVVWEDGLPHTGKYRPAVGGTSVGHYSITAGTLGTAGYLEGVRIFLSNNHVLAACNEASIGDDIYQPGPYDGGTVNDKLGELLDFIYVIPEGGDEYNEVDAAIAVPTVEAELSMEIADLTPGAMRTHAAEVGMVVTKSGRTTGVTTQPVAAIDGAIRVQYPTFIAAFINQIIINTSAFVQGGDSGSACFEYNEEASASDLVGLVFAGSMFSSIVCPIAPIMAKWDLKFSPPVDLYGVIKRNGHAVSGVKILVFNLSRVGSEFVSYLESDGNGTFNIIDAVYQYETAIVFAQYTMGATEYGGYKRIRCNQDTNYAVVNLSEYTPVPDGLFCKFKLLGDFLNCDISTNEYFSNLF